VFPLPNKIILVLGGARSGKSRFAEELAQELGGQVTYIATAEARDLEMAERIARHQASRPAAWKTIEAPLELAEAIRTSAGANVVIVDCVTLYLTNLMMRELGPIGEAENPAIPLEVEAKIQTQITELIQAAKESSALIILVANEVGLGLVPPFTLGRFFRDLAGRTNREIAAAADKVFLLTAGIAVELKAISVTSRQASLEIKK
jgi:adenosylcobinamide kinase/adenosylcobinamide-phosphate guanylyltransferase